MDRPSYVMYIKLIHVDRDGTSHGTVHGLEMMPWNPMGSAMERAMGRPNAMRRRMARPMGGEVP